MVDIDDSRQIHIHDSDIIITVSTRIQQCIFIHVNNIKNTRSDNDQPSYGKHYLLHNKFFVATKAPTTIQLPFEHIQKLNFQPKSQLSDVTPFSQSVKLLLCVDLLYTVAFCWNK